MVKKSLPSWFRQGPQEGLVHVNVGGLRRSLSSNTLRKFPDTRLGKLLACDSEEDILQVGLGSSAASLGSFLRTRDLRPSRLLSSPHLASRCATTTTCSGGSFTLTGTRASSRTSCTSTRRGNSTSWRSCVSSPSGPSTHAHTHAHARQELPSHSEVLCISGQKPISSPFNRIVGGVSPGAQPAGGIIESTFCT